MELGQNHFQKTQTAKLFSKILRDHFLKIYLKDTTQKHKIILRILLLVHYFHPMLTL